MWVDSEGVYGVVEIHLFGLRLQFCKSKTANGYGVQFFLEKLRTVIQVCWRADLVAAEKCGDKGKV